MYIAAYCDWRIDLDDIRFFYEEFTGFVADLADLGLGDYLACSKLGNSSMTM